MHIQTSARESKGATKSWREKSDLQQLSTGSLGSAKEGEAQKSNNAETSKMTVMWEFLWEKLRMPCGLGKPL